MLDVKEAAEKLKTSKDYLYRHADKLPFTVHVGRDAPNSHDDLINAAAGVLVSVAAGSEGPPSGIMFW